MHVTSRSEGLLAPFQAPDVAGSDSDTEVKAESDSTCSDQQVSPLCVWMCTHTSALAVLDLTWHKELSVDTRAHTETVEDLAITGGRAE